MAGTRRRSERTKTKTPQADVQETPRESMGDPAQQSDQPPMQAAPSREDIERRAYDLYRQRGGGDGGDLDDWLAAERQLRPE